VKLQEAYVSEANKVGSWKLIGYVAPGSTSASTAGQTTNFDYTASNPAIDGDAADISGYLDALVAWTAKNRVALNDCAVSDDNKWTVSVKAATNGNSVTYTAAVSPNCQQLTLGRIPISSSPFF
jgi:hypothetical protein